MGNKKMSGWVLLVLLFSSLSFAYESGFAPPASLGQLSKDSEIVVQGTFLERHKEFSLNPDTKQEMPIWVNTFKTVEVFKGNVGSTFEIRQLAASSRRDAFRYGAFGAFDTTRYQPDKEYILFLGAINRFGFRTVADYNQGKFDVEKDPQGKATVANTSGNQRLFHGIQSKSLSLSKSEQSVVQAPPGPIPLEDFTSILRKALQ